MDKCVVKGFKLAYERVMVEVSVTSTFLNSSLLDANEPFSSKRLNTLGSQLLETDARCSATRRGHALLSSRCL